jgi:hypothetical protein
MFKSNEVKSSNHCELEGLKRSVRFLGAERIGVLVTDRHRMVGKYIREHLPDTTHYFDVWHVAKGCSKLECLPVKLCFCSCSGSIY